MGGCGAMVHDSHKFAKAIRHDTWMPLGTIGNEITGKDSLVQQDLSLIFEIIRNKLSAFLNREKALGRLSKLANETDMANFRIASIKQGMLLGKVKHDTRSCRKYRSSGARPSPL
jgi:hypothetical protein